MLFDLRHKNATAVCPYGGLAKAVWATADCRRQHDALPIKCPAGGGIRTLPFRRGATVPFPSPMPTYALRPPSRGPPRRLRRLWVGAAFQLDRSPRSDRFGAGRSQLVETSPGWVGGIEAACVRARCGVSPFRTPWECRDTYTVPPIAVDEGRGAKDRIDFLARN